MSVTSVTQQVLLNAAIYYAAVVAAATVTAVWAWATGDLSNGERIALVLLVVIAGVTTRSALIRAVRQYQRSNDSQLRGLMLGWVDDYAYGFRREPSDPFAFLVTDRLSRGELLVRKPAERRVRIESTIPVVDSQISEAQRSSVNLELARFPIDWRWHDTVSASDGEDMLALELGETLFVSINLDSQEFFNALNRVRKATTLASLLMAPLDSEDDIE